MIIFHLTSCILSFSGDSVILVQLNKCSRNTTCLGFSEKISLNPKFPERKLEKGSRFPDSRKKRELIRNSNLPPPLLTGLKLNTLRAHNISTDSDTVFQKKA